jgi:copper chaperone CopZ
MVSSMTEKTYVVEGMTCGHCTRSVEEEVSELEGVQVLEVDLESGRLVVRGETVDDEAVRSAVTEAGYALRA